jgi:hypothetical protein
VVAVAGYGAEGGSGEGGAGDRAGNKAGDTEETAAAAAVTSTGDRPDGPGVVVGPTVLVRRSSVVGSCFVAPEGRKGGNATCEATVTVVAGEGGTSKDGDGTGNEMAERGLESTDRFLDDVVVGLAVFVVSPTDEVGAEDLDVEEGAGGDEAGDEA